MTVFGIGSLRAAMVGMALLALAGSAAAAEPTASEIATARKLIDLKGASKMYDPVLVGIIEKTKYTLLQTNPALSRDLDAVAAQLRIEFQPQLEQLKNDVAKLYASHFTEQELNDAYTFFKSPLGAKLIVTEPQILDESIRHAGDWANKVADQVLIRMRAEMHKRGHDL